MAENVSDFLKGRECKGFTPRPHYVRGGDYVTFFFSDAFPYEERVDELLTVYRTFDTGEMVGCKINGVKRILRELGSFRVNIDDGKVRLGLLFLVAAKLTRPANDDDAIYKDLARKAGGTEMDAKDFQAA